MSPCKPHSLRANLHDPTIATQLFALRCAGATALGAYTATVQGFAFGALRVRDVVCYRMRKLMNRQACNKHEIFALSFVAASRQSLHFLLMSSLELGNATVTQSSAMGSLRQQTT